MNIRRGDIYYADLSPVVGSEQGGIRPVLIIQSAKANLPTHIRLYADNSGLSKDSVVLLEQIRTLDKRRLKEKMGSLGSYDMYKVDEALSISFGLGTESSQRRTNEAI